MHSLMITQATQLPSSAVIAENEGIKGTRSDTLSPFTCLWVERGVSNSGVELNIWRLNSMS